VVLDLESTGLQPWYGNRITCICAKDSNGERFHRSEEQEHKIIDSFFSWLTKRSANKFNIVTYNGKEFDIPFILARLAQMINLDTHNALFLLEYPHIDLKEIVEQITGKRLALDTVTRLLGCTPKSGTGTNAIGLWKKRQLDKLMEYCSQDVDTTEKVYLKLQ